MPPLLLNLWDRLRGSFWLVPAIFCTAALVLTFSLPWLAELLSAWQLELPPWLRTSPDNARSTLAAIGSAMITVTGTVFSVTIVTLSLASQQFGSRLLRRFMNDWPTQFTLAVFLSTGFFCFFSLRTLYQERAAVSAADLAVTIAEVLAAISMGMLIVYINHVATMIQAASIVAAVARDLDGSMQQLFPQRAGYSLDVGDEERKRVLERAIAGREARDIASSHEGYVQAIDEHELIEIGRRRDLVLLVRARPGDFVAQDGVLAQAWLPPDTAREDETAIASEVNATLVVGKRSTPRQDIEAAVDELVQVAVRALSPGINDPFTAISCIDRLGAALGRLAARDWPTPHRSDAAGELRVVARTFEFPVVLGTAFHEIRRYARGHAGVTLHLLDTLAVLAGRLRRPQDIDAVRRHAELVLRGLDACPEEFDRDDGRRRHTRVTEALEACARDVLQRREDLGVSERASGAPPGGSA